MTVSKNQYVTRLQAWGIRKNATKNIWAFVDRRRRQRKLEHRKETGFSIHGRRLPAQTGGITALRAAVQYGTLEVLGALLDLDSLLPSPASGDISILPIAIRRRNLQILELLVRSGVDINGSHLPPERTPLLCAFSNGWREGVELLLHEGAHIHGSVYGPDVQCTRKSAVQIAINLGCAYDVMQTLIEAHGEFNHECCGDILTKAVANWPGLSSSNDLRLAQLLHDRMADLPDASRIAQLRKACDKIDETFMSVDRLRFLIDAGVDINQRHLLTGTTMLQRLLNRDLSYRTHGLCSFLLHHGAEINVPATCTEHTPLQAAIKHENIGIVEMLLERGADVNAPPAEFSGLTALQGAAIHGWLGIAIKLLENGARVAAPGAKIHGRSAIEGAAEWGRLEMLQLLLDVYEQPEELRTVCIQAAEYAKLEGHHEIARWLRNYRHA